MNPGIAGGRVAWVDYAKGFCIVMVVMMHSTLGVEKAAGVDGWMHHVVEFARPFRMPDFFLISGLFLARVIDREWRDYLDRKVVHFAYFYVLWLTIQFAFKAPGMAAEAGWEGALGAYLLAFIDPFGTLWFIYLLPIFFVVTKATRGLPPVAIWLAGAALQVLPIETGWVVVDEFASRFVYFYTGYLFAPMIFRFAAAAMEHPGIALAGLAAWSVLNGGLVYLGLADLPFVSLALGFAGAGAVVIGSVLLSRSTAAAFLRYLGEHSIVVYLAFFLPMAVTRTVFLKLGIVADIGAISLLVTLAGVAGPVILYWIVRGTPARFLFARPSWARLQPAGRLVPAE